MAIVRWEPFREMVTIQDRINRVFPKREEAKAKQISISVTK